MLTATTKRFFSTVGGLSQVQVNGKSYKLPKVNQPVVGICLDGTAQEYIDYALRAGKMPALERMRTDGMLTEGLVQTAFPTFTNPNNVSIMTGQPPKVTGICGNFYLNMETKQEVMMNTTDLIRCDSIFAKLADAGTQITVVTSKDKLRSMLSYQLPSKHLGSHIKNTPTGKLAIFSDASASKQEEVDVASLTNQIRCFSVESMNNNPNTKLSEPFVNLVGRPAPSVYEHDNSTFSHFYLLS